jgi:hypothetical protein
MHLLGVTHGRDHRHDRRATEQCLYHRIAAPAADFVNQQTTGEKSALIGQ